MFNKNNQQAHINQQGSALARAETEHPRGSSASSAAPGVVIPGERLNDSPIPDSGERHEMFVKGKRLVSVAHPIPASDTPGYSAITDYLNCSFPFEADTINLPNFFTDLAKVAGDQFALVKNRGKGMNGYEKSFDIGEDGAKFCCVGQRDTALLMLPGKACHSIPDWPALIVLLRDKYGARITRWDGAVDDFEGTHSVDWAVEQYQAGLFTNGGNKPSCNQNGNWIEPDGTGRTFYVGKRQNGKMLRVYEKGMQCGQAWHPWVRWEVELHNVDRIVPWDVLLEPGKYVAGAYPKAMGWVQEEMSRIRTVQTEAQLAYSHLVKCASTAYGRLLNVMVEVEQSPEAVIERLRLEGMPKRLKMPLVADKKA